jgi:hypothetical protein
MKIITTSFIYDVDWYGQPLDILLAVLAILVLLAVMFVIVLERY